MIETIEDTESISAPAALETEAQDAIDHLSNRKTPAIDELTSWLFKAQYGTRPCGLKIVKE